MQQMNPVLNLKLKEFKNWTHHVIHLDDITPEIKNKWKLENKTLKHYIYHGLKTSLSVVFISLGVTTLFAIMTHDPGIRKYRVTSFDCAVASIVAGFLTIWLIDRVHQRQEMQRDEEDLQYRKELKEENKHLSEENKKMRESINNMSNEIADIKCNDIIERKVDERLRGILYDLRFANSSSSVNIPVNRDKELNKRTNKQFIDDIINDK
jgi:cell division protein FtsB